MKDHESIVKGEHKKESQREGSRRPQVPLRQLGKVLRYNYHYQGICVGKTAHRFEVMSSLNMRLTYIGIILFWAIYKILTSI